MNYEKCPDCGITLINDHCHGCGFEKAKPRGDNHRCAYQSGERCPLPGTMTDSNRATESTEWFCRYHYGTFGRVAHQILQQILSGDLTIEKKNWREVVIDAQVAKYRVSNPELFFQSTNQADKDDYHSMMMAFAKSIKSTTKLPYNKHKRVEIDEEALLTGREIAA